MCTKNLIWIKKYQVTQAIWIITIKVIQTIIQYQIIRVLNIIIKLQWEILIDLRDIIQMKRLRLSIWCHLVDPSILKIKIIEFSQEIRKDHRLVGKVKDIIITQMTFRTGTLMWIVKITGLNLIIIQIFIHQIANSIR